MERNTYSMKELWIKKTVYRRYLIEDSEIGEVEAIIKGDPERADELITDLYDRNQLEEYDQEEIILPIEYSIADE